MIACMRRLYQERERLQQSVCCRHHHLQQVSDDVHGCVQVGANGVMDLIFIDAGVRINGAYYREVLLTQKLLPVMGKVGGEFFIFQ